MNLTDKIVIVTGGGTGIGRATALHFAEHGARVVICGRRQDRLIEAAQRIKQCGGQVLFVTADVRDWKQALGMVNTVLRQFSKVDILVNNAGVAYAKSILETTEDEWDETLDTNLKGIFFCCKAVLPSMVEAGNGVIINISSVLGQKGITNMSAYCASKFGVIGLTQSLADEFKLKGIRVYTVCPGSTYTDLHSKVVGKEIAKMAMPQEKVAAGLIDLITGKLELPSGGLIVIDEQPVQTSLNQLKAILRQVVLHYMKPTLPILRKVRNFFK